MKWTLFFLLAVSSACAQTYVKPYSLSVGISEKLDQKLIGPQVAASPYSFNNAASIGLNYRTPQDRIRIGLTYGHTFQTRSNFVSAEIRYNIFQWGRRPRSSGPRPTANPFHW